MRTQERSLLAELEALQRINPTEAKQRFYELTQEELRMLSMELGLRIYGEAFLPTPNLQAA